MFGNPTEIALLVAAAAILFGADRIPKLARGLGQAKKEFQLGQAEADAETERLKAEARAHAEPAPHAGAVAAAETGTAPSATTTTGSAVPAGAPAIRVQQD
jgi:sec-independent protein translocase protein TatA